MGGKTPGDESDKLATRSVLGAPGRPSTVRRAEGEAMIGHMAVGDHMVGAGGVQLDGNMAKAKILKFRSLQYSEYEGKPREWILNRVTFGDIALMVGKNASGKTRVLNIINGLASLLSGKAPTAYLSGHWRVEFEVGNSEYSYEVKFENHTVATEILKLDGKVYLKRATNGIGKIFHAGEAKQLKFQAPSSRLAAVLRRDSIQHPFLEPLFEWGSSVEHFAFGTELGKSFVAIFKDSSTGSENISDAGAAETLDPNQVVALFRRGEKKFGRDFASRILRDLKPLGYDCTEIGLEVLESTDIKSPFPPSCLFLQERDLPCHTRQIEMSMGMFRSLALAIRLNFAIMTGSPICILIDDIGEGLDFERSSSLIQMLIQKAEKTPFQLFMTTNDRFVMNGVPLKYWSIIHRMGGTVAIINEKNNKKVFDNFRFMGLNNFDFFAKELYLPARKEKK